MDLHPIKQSTSVVQEALPVATLLNSGTNSHHQAHSQNALCKVIWGPHHRAVFSHINEQGKM